MQASDKKEVSCKTKIFFYNEFLQTLYFFYISIIILIFLSFSVYSQNLNLAFEHFSVDQDESSSDVSAIYQDRTGYLWFGTDNGAYRYDGYNFTPFKYVGDSINIRTLFTQAITEDDEGNIWIAAYNNGLQKLNIKTKVFTNHLPEPEQAKTSQGNYILAVYTDKEDQIWVGTITGLYKYIKNNNTFASYKHAENDPYSLGHNSVNGIYEDRDGTLWLATGGGLERFDRKTNKFFHYWHYPNNSWQDIKTEKHWVQAIIEDASGNLWLGTDGGLVEFNKKNETFASYTHDSQNPSSLGNDKIRSLCDDGSGRLWIATYNGLDAFDKSTKIFSHYRHDQKDPKSLSSNYVISVFLDRSGSLWIATNRGGVNRLNHANPSFTKYSSNPWKKGMLSSEKVYHLFESVKGTIWICTENGLEEFDPKTESFIKPTYYLNYNVIIQDNAGSLLVAPGMVLGGLYKLNHNNHWTCYLDSLTGTYDRVITSMCSSHNGQVWIGTSAGEMYLFNPLTSQKKWITTKVSGSMSIIYEDSYGLVWFGGFETGIFCYDPHKDTISQFISDPKNTLTLDANTVLSLFEDQTKTLWFGSSRGLNKYNRSQKTFTRVTGKDGFLSGGVKKILEDDHSNLWMSTEKGITKFNPLTGEFNNNYPSDKFPGIKFIVQSGCLTEDGEMYFGGTNGFIRFHPDSIKDDTFIPPVVITSFLKFEKPFLFGREIELAHSDNFISFEFAALSYINSAENQYAYKMEGLDKDWIYCGTRRYASYANIAPGEYVFRVKGSTSNRIWNDAGTSIKVIILPPWWKTWSAYLFYTIVLLSVFILFTRFYLNRQRLRQKLLLESEHAEKLEEIAKMKSDFFANISHEFRTPLALILGPAEKIEKNQSANPVKDASIITRNSKRLLQLINQLLDLSKLDAGKLKLEASPANIVSFIKGIALSFESLSEARDVLIKIKSDKEFIEVYFDKEKMFKTFSNLLSNAFKFTPEREYVIVTIAESINNTVEIRIRNSGIGIPQKELPKLFDRFYQVDSSQTKEYEGTGIGLALVKELIELHHGSISVYSKESNPEEKEKGWTEFTINLPLGRTHLKDEEILAADKESIQKETAVYGAEYLSPRILVELEIIPDESKTTILVVEDNYDMREYIKESLSDTYSVEEAVNGEQGVRIAETIIPDLIISDLMMPKMDGNELTRILKNDERTSHIPIIILTAKSGQENKIEGLQTGADDYLTKPFDLQELRVRVENLINIRKKLQEKFSKGEFLSKRLDKKLKSIDEKFLAKVLEVIEKHISEEEFSIEECSSEVGLSRTHFHKKLRALVGKSPSQYVRTVRLYCAKQMIEEEKGNISEVAYSVGFSSPAYFSRCFKEEFGYPPSNILT